MPDNHSRVVPFVQGDGIGVDISPAMRMVLDAAVAKAYNGSKTIQWLEVLAGLKAHKELGAYLPEKTLEAFRQHRVGIKGPLTTPTGKGIRSLNVAIRQTLDLYSCIRPIKWYGSSSALRKPENVDVVIFRENTEGLYAGVEFQSGSPEARRVIELLGELGVEREKLDPDSGLGFKIASPHRSKRHVRRALRYALEHGRGTVTIMHKGNIMRHTEGAFWNWSREVAREPEFSGLVGSPQESPLESTHWKIRMEDRIADNMFQQVSTMLGEFDLVVTTNLNGDYLSEAAAGMVGGIAMVPSCNMGDDLAVFEAAHGSVPKYAGQNKANPTSLILSGALMLSHFGWTKSAKMIEDSVKRTLSQRLGTFDLVRGWTMAGERDLHELSCSEFAAAIVDQLQAVDTEKIDAKLV